MALPSAASVVSSGLAASAAVYYDRVAVDTLRSNLFLYPACDLKQMPDRSGTVMQIFGYTAYGPNTTPATEGTPGNGQTLTQVTKQITLSQYVDYLSFSDRVALTAISDTVAEGAAELAFRGALSVDTTISTLLDTVATGDANSRISLTTGTYFTAGTSRKAGSLLRAQNVRPKANGKFFGVMNSLVSYDFTNDANAGGFIDLQKYTDTNARKLQEGISGNSFIGEVGGVEWYESNSLPMVAGTPNVYHSYVIGAQSLFGSSLGKTALGQKNFAVKVSKFTQPIAVDPASQIAAAASYNFFWGVSPRPGTVSGFKQIACESSIG